MYTRYKINPTIGKKKLNTENPAFGSSFTSILFLAEQPQLGHTTASSKISLPHLEQNFIKILLAYLLFRFGIINIIILFWNFVKCFLRDIILKKNLKGQIL